MTFFAEPLTFRVLLECLRVQCVCDVTLQDSGGIPDSRGGTSGELYYVERTDSDGQLRFAFIEIFHMDVIVLPDLVRSICQQLNLSEGDLRRTLH